MNQLPVVAPKWALFASSILFASCAMATEGGGSSYPNGLENFMAAAVPPPGVYGLVYGEHYTTDKLVGPNGQALNVPNFSVSATVVAPRVLWVAPSKILDGSPIAHITMPLVDLSATVGSVQQRKSGLADMVAGGGLAWHHSPQLHSVAALDVYLPVGSYNKSDLVNLGRNYFSVEPVLAVTYVDPNGLNFDIKAGVVFNQKNRETNYRSGTELHADYAIGWGVGQGLVVGLGGYAYQQITDDESSGALVSNQKGKALAIGPSVKYDSGKGWLVTAKWQKEYAVRNRTEGSALWLKAVFPF